VEEKHQEDVVLLAVSLDDESTRSKIPAFLKRHDLHCKVLLSEPHQLEGYQSDTASILYVVNRGGLLAGVPGEFGRNLGKQAEARIALLSSSSATPGPLLYRIEKAPPGFGLLWRTPLKDDVKAIAIAPATSGHPAEVGVLDATHLKRYSAAGEPLGESSESNIEGRDATFLKGADLDGDGRNEWLVGEEKSFTVVDAQGDSFWRYWTLADSLQIGGFMDLDRDGRLETIVQDGSRVVARQALSGTLWKTPPLGTIRSIVRDPRGAFLVQIGQSVRSLDRTGRLGNSAKPLPSQAILAGRLAAGDAPPLDLFRPEATTQVEIVQNLAGDGKEEILVVTGGVLSIYSRKGDLLARLISPNNWSPRLAVGDLDGRKGDEVVVALPDFGLVALGMSPPSGKTERARSGS